MSDVEQIKVEMSKVLDVAVTCFFYACRAIDPNLDMNAQFNTVTQSSKVFWDAKITIISQGQPFYYMVWINEDGEPEGSILEEANMHSGGQPPGMQAAMDAAIRAAMQNG